MLSSKTSFDRNESQGMIAVLETHKPKRLGAIDEETAADPALVLHHPVAVAVLTNHEQWRLKTRRRFGFLCFLHGSSLLNSSIKSFPTEADPAGASWNRQVVIVLRGQCILTAEQLLLDRCAMFAFARERSRNLRDKLPPFCDDRSDEAAQKRRAAR